MLNILIPVDGSRSALLAVEYVIQYRALHKESINVNLSNVQPRMSKYLTRFVPTQNVTLFQQERAEKALESAIGLLTKAGVEHTVHMDKGDAASAIVACAKKTQSEKIIIGTTRKNALTRFFEGSVVNKVMALTDLPVEVVAKDNASKLQRFGIPIGVGLTFLWLAVE